MNVHSAKLVWRGFDGFTLPGWLHGHLAAGACSGIVLFGRNVQDPPQLHSLCREAARAAGGHTPFLCVDQEGGRVARLREPHFTHFPSARRMAHSGDGELIRRMGRAMGEEMAAVGINLDFAPVLDVQESLDGVIGDRAFSGRPEDAASAALAWLDGLQDAGVVGCVKHFPGHGDASCDSHVDLPTAEGDAHRTRRHHLATFQRAVRAGVKAVMVGHLLVTHEDPRHPATLSRTLVDGWLRQGLGFDGLVITDDMEMGAITRRWGLGEAAVLAVAAGCDVVLVCASRPSQEEAVEALAREASRSPAFHDRVEQSVARIQRLGRTLQPPPPSLDAGAIRSPAHLDLARSVPE